MDLIEFKGVDFCLCVNYYEGRKMAIYNGSVYFSCVNKFHDEPKKNSLLPPSSLLGLRTQLYYVCDSHA